MPVKRVGSARETVGVTSDRVLYHNARVLTMDPAQPFADAFVVAGSRFAAAGDRDGLCSSRMRTVDLHGGFVCPAFTDCHVHPVSGGLTTMRLDLRDVMSRAEFRERLARYADSLPPDAWVRARNYAADFWPDGPPTRHDLDAACGGRPAFVQRTDGHVGVAGSRALELGGVTRETPDVPDGIIERDESGQLTGVLKDGAMGLVYRVIPAASDHGLRDALVAAMAEAARNGVGTCHGLLSPREYGVLRELLRDAPSKQARCRMPAWIGLGGNGWRNQLAEIARLRQETSRDEWPPVHGVKLFYDGALGSRTALFAEPYHDNPEGERDFAGVQCCDHDTLTRQVLAAMDEGVQPAVHAIGDLAVSRTLDILSAASPEAREGIRSRIEHAQHLLATDVPRFAALGVTASMQPRHLYDDGDFCEPRIGRGRCPHTYMLRSLIESGASVCFGSDWPVAEMSPLLGIHAAVTRRTRRDTYGPEGWVPDERITPIQALRAYTSVAAWTERVEKTKGRIAPGHLADFTVLSDDPTACPPDAIPEIRVLQTVVGGQTTFAAE